jgi:hypothetical protein
MGHKNMYPYSQILLALRSTQLEVQRCKKEREFANRQQNRQKKSTGNLRGNAGDNLRMISTELNLVANSLLQQMQKALWLHLLPCNCSHANKHR